MSYAITINGHTDEESQAKLFAALFGVLNGKAEEFGIANSYFSGTNVGAELHRESEVSARLVKAPAKSPEKPSSGKTSSR